MFRYDKNAHLNVVTFDGLWEWVVDVEGTNSKVGEGKSQHSWYGLEQTLE